MNKKIFIVQLISCICLVLLSLIGILFKNYDLVLCIGIGSICSLLYLLLLVKGGHMIHPNEEKNRPGLFYLFVLLRYLVIILGIALPCLIIHLTNKEFETYRYLNVIGTIIPYLSCTIILAIEKKDI